MYPAAGDAASSLARMVNRTASRLSPPSRTAAAYVATGALFSAAQAVMFATVKSSPVSLASASRNHAALSGVRNRRRFFRIFRLNV